MNNKLLLIGGGGHCRSVLDTIYRIETYDDIGIIDTAIPIGNYVLDTPVIGTDEDLKKLYEEGYQSAFITIGTIDNFDLKFKLVQHLQSIGFSLPNIIDPAAEVSAFGELGEGIFIGKQAIINANFKIGDFVIINTGAVCEHDIIIQDYSHIAPRATLLGGVDVGEKTHIGANTTVKQGISIGSDTLIGMASNVLQPIKSNVIAYGNPCKVVGKK